MHRGKRAAAVKLRKLMADPELFSATVRELRERHGVGHAAIVSARSQMAKRAPAQFAKAADRRQAKRDFKKLRRAHARYPRLLKLLPKHVNSMASLRRILGTPSLPRMYDILAMLRQYADSRGMSLPDAVRRITR